MDRLKNMTNSKMKKNKKIYDVLIVGGGPAGMMAGLAARKISNEISIGILDTNARLGRKLKITGGGRCNFTNNEYIGNFFDHIVSNEKFLYSALYSFTNEDLKEMVKSIGLDYSVEEDNYNKVYLKSGNSEDFIDGLVKKLLGSNIDIYYNTKITKIKKVCNNNLADDTKEIGYIDTENMSPVLYNITSTGGQAFTSRGLILATGGMSFKNTGSDGQMFGILSSQGYKIIEPKPGLVPINLDEAWLKSLSGISFRDVILEMDTKYSVKKTNKNNKTSVQKNKKNNKGKSVSIRGDIIITHKGIGGPASLKISSLINRMDFEENNILNLDLLPDISCEDLYTDIISNPNEILVTVLKKYLPKRYVTAIIDEMENLEKESKFDYRSDKLGNMSKKIFENVLAYTKNIRLTVVGLMGIDSATITAGGVSVNNVNPSTMESKIDDNIFFAGEMLDVDAMTGGYNLQIAFSTGYLAGVSIVDKLNIGKIK